MTASLAGSAASLVAADSLHAAPCASQSGPPASPRVVIRAGGRSLPVEVEVARTEPERERGLMFRERLEPGHGMLFVFDEESSHSFWMKDTLIPLDMIFIESSRRVVGIVARAEPRTLAPRTVAAPSRYVLEVPGGWAEANGVRPGDAVRLEGPGLGE